MSSDSDCHLLKYEVCPINFRILTFVPSLWSRLPFTPVEDSPYRFSFTDLCSLIIIQTAVYPSRMSALSVPIYWPSSSPGESEVQVVSGNFDDVIRFCSSPVGFIHNGTWGRATNRNPKK